MRPEDPTPRNRRRLDANEPEGDAPLRRRRSRSADNLDTPAEAASATPKPKPSSTPKPRARKVATGSTPKPEPTPAATPVVVPQPTPRAQAASTAGKPDTPADQFLINEIARTRTNLRATIWLGTIFVVAVFISLYYMTSTFTSNLEPQSAATISKGIIGQYTSEHLPELKTYVKEQIPTLIRQVPDYVKTELPKYRQNLTSKLESDIALYAKQTAPELSAKMDDFFRQNKDAVGQLLQNNEDPVAQAAVTAGLKNMFSEYLRSAQINGETLDSKINQSLTALDSVDYRLKYLAANKGLSENEKRARRAIAILLLKVDENQPQLAGVGNTVREDVTPLNGVLQWKSQDEAVFTAPGKPPVVFKRVVPIESGAAKPSAPSEGANAKGNGKGMKASKASAKSQ